MSLVDDTYQLVTLFPNDEKFSLKTQILRCSISIPSNIAEGSSKSSDKHFSHYLEMSLGSAFEWETQIIIAHRQEYINKKQYTQLENKIQKLQRMISSFQERLKC